MVMSWVAANRPKPVPPHRSTSSPHVKMTTSRVDGSNMESIAHFAEAATNAIHSQRREIDRLSGCLGRLENDVHFLKKFMTEMQRNISKRTFDENREQIMVAPAPAADLKLTIHEVGKMNESIATLNTKATEFDGMRLEMSILKSRLKRLEANSMRNFHRLSTGSYVIDTGGSYFASTTRHASTRYSLSQTGKRRIIEAETALESNNPLSTRVQPSFSGWKRVRYSQDPDTLSSPTNPGATRTPLPNLPDSPSAQNQDYHADNPDHSSTTDPHDTDQLWQIEVHSQSLQTSGLETIDCHPAINGNICSPISAEGVDAPMNTSTAASPDLDSVHDSLLTVRASKTPKSRRRRGRSDCLRDENGVRIRKNGKPDGRAGNYKYLKAYYEKKKALKEQQKEKETRDAQSAEARDSEEPELEVEERQLPDEPGLQLSRDALERIAGAAHARIRRHSSD